MKTGAKKRIYALGAVIMAVVVFLFSLFCLENFGPGQDEKGGSVSGTGGDTGDDIGSGTDQGGAGGGGGGASKPKILFTVLTDQTQRLYLRQDSKGDYTGKGEHGFVGDQKYYLEYETDVSPLFYFGTTMLINGYAPSRAEIELIHQVNELLPATTLRKNEGETAKKYTVDYYLYDYLTDGVNFSLPFAQGSYYEQEKRYREFVKEHYLQIPPSLKQTLLSLAAENYISASESTVIGDVVRYIRGAASYNIKYATTNYPSDKDMVTYFLTGTEGGVCRHFAAAATMMFRALGVPARYTIGFAVDVQANVKLEYVGDGHAWTEVYLDEYGWVTLEVTGS